MAVSYEALLEVLTAAEQPGRGDVQRQAEQQLAAWEGEPGLHYLFQEIYLKTDIPLRVRWMAVICFKNGVERLWRASRTNAIGKDEKAQIRSRVFALLAEPNAQLAIQNAHAIARIVRFDFPAEWPDFFDAAAQKLEHCIFASGDLVAARNLLVVLNQCVKSVAAVRIGRARHAFQSKAPLLVPVLAKSYLKLFHAWTSSQDPDLAVVETCYMCLKNLRRVIPEGFEQPHRNQDAAEFVRVTVGHMQALVAAHEASPADSTEKYVKAYSKLYAGIIQTNPTAFVLMPSATEIVQTYLQMLEQKAEAVYTAAEDSDFWDTLALKAFLVLKKMLAYVYKQGAVTLKQRADKEEVARAIALLKNQVFTPQVATHLCDLIISWYLRLRPSDLESWLLEPEEWTNEQLGASWEFQVRPCAENFFEDLVRFFKDELSAHILERISAGLAASGSLDDLDVLATDATLCTFQLSADSIADKLSFDHLLKQVFVPAGMRCDRAEHKIIRRRICLVIGAWVGVDCSREGRVEIYRLLLEFMATNAQTSAANDKVVRLSAAQSLRAVISDWDFEKHDFQPYLADFAARLLAMLADLSFTESKLYVLDTLAALLERCNPLVDRATLASILQIVPSYWSISGENGNGNEPENESILQASLLRVLRHLVAALNQHSAETHAITLPLVRGCCTPAGSDGHYGVLAEDGFDLWLAIVQYYPVSPKADAEIDRDPQIAQLFALLHPALVDSTEILTTILAIARSYALLLPSAYISDYGIQVFRVLAGYIPTMRDDAFDAFIALMDILLLSQGDNDTFVNCLVTSGLVAAFVQYVLDENHSTVLANKLLAVLARMAWRSPQAFFQICSVLSLDAARLVDVWMSYYKNNGNPRDKKVSLLALLALLAYATPRDMPDFAKHLGETLRRCFLYLEEVHEEPSGNSKAYEGDYVYSEVDNYAYLDAEILPHGEKIRYQRLLESTDPVYTVNLREVVRGKVQGLRAEAGEGAFAAMMAQNDAYTNEKLQELLC